MFDVETGETWATVARCTVQVTLSVTLDTDLPLTAFISFSFQWSLSWGERSAGCRSTGRQGSSLSAVSLAWPFSLPCSPKLNFKVVWLSRGLYLYSDLSYAELFVLILASKCCNYYYLQPQQQHSLSDISYLLSLDHFWNYNIWLVCWCVMHKGNLNWIFYLVAIL